MIQKLWKSQRKCLHKCIVQAHPEPGNKEIQQCLQYDNRYIVVIEYNGLMIDKGRGNTQWCSCDTDRWGWQWGPDLPQGCDIVHPSNVLISQSNLPFLNLPNAGGRLESRNPKLCRMKLSGGQWSLQTEVCLSFMFLTFDSNAYHRSPVWNDILKITLWPSKDTFVTIPGVEVSWIARLLCRRLRW